MEPTSQGLTPTQDAVISAYYQASVARPSAARSRAQAAQAASALLATAGLAALATMATAPVTATRIAVWLAACAWALTSFAYLKAAAEQVDLPQNEGTNDPAEFVRLVLSRAKSEQDKIDLLQRRANRLAIAATLLTLVAAFLSATLSDSRSATVTLAPSPLQRDAIRTSCPHEPVDLLKGTYEMREVVNGVAPVRLILKACPNRSITIHVELVRLVEEQETND